MLKNAIPNYLLGQDTTYNSVVKDEVANYTASNYEKSLKLSELSDIFNALIDANATIYHNGNPVPQSVIDTVKLAVKIGIEIGIRDYFFPS